MKSVLEVPRSELKAEEMPSPQKRILLVDDDPAIRQLLMRLIADENFEVLTAANGAEALALAASMNFDLVVLDLNMPVKNGWETFEQLSSQNPVLPIILITARPNQFFPAMAAGVGALLEKPLDFAKLFDTIRNLLQEPPESRMARMAGQPALFRYVPPKPETPERKAH